MQVELMHKGDYLKVTIEHDQHAENPRNECDPVTFLHTWHNEYQLGGRGDLNNMVRPDCREDYELLLEDYAMTLPVYLLDHSGLKISTSPFNCNWDSGQVGFIGMTANEVSNYPNLKAAMDAMEQDIETLNAFLSGEVYQYIIEKHIPGTCKWETIESCCGIYADGELDAIKDFVDKDLYKAIEGKL